MIPSGKQTSISAEDIPSEGSQVRMDSRLGHVIPATGTSTTGNILEQSRPLGTKDISTLGQAVTYTTASGERVQGFGEPVVISSVPISQLGVPITQSVNYQPSTATTATNVIRKEEVHVDRPIYTTPTSNLATSGTGYTTGGTGYATSGTGYATTGTGHVTTGTGFATSGTGHVTTGTGFATTGTGIPATSTYPVGTTTGLATSGVITTEAPRTNLGTSTITQPLQYSEIRSTTVVNQPVMEGVSNVSEIQPVEEHMRDSISMGRQTESPTHQSRWEAQQAQLSSMRYENHQTFENWEVNRNLFFSDRLNVMDDLLAGMERKLDWLDAGVQKCILFFKERESQEIEYSKRVKHGLTQLGEHFERVEHGEAMSDFSRGMKESDAFHAQDTRNSEVLGLFIKKDILDWILIPSEKEYKLQAHSLRVPIADARKKLESVGKQRAKRYNKYFKVYDQIQRHPTKVSPKDDGVFQKQLKYSLSAREELRLLRLYDEQGLLVISEFTRLATVRMGEIQRAFSLYLQKYTELYSNSAPAPTPILELIERANGPEAIQALFSPRSLMSVPNYDFLTKKLGTSDITYPDLTSFLINFPESVDPARSSFVLREWDAVKEGSLLKRPKACTIIATTGNSLLIVEKKHEEQELGKVKVPLQTRFTKVENIEEGVDGTTLKVVERTPGTLFTHTHSTRLKFETQEDAQSFVNYLSNQTSQMIGDV